MPVTAWTGSVRSLPAHVTEPDITSPMAGPAQGSGRGPDRAGHRFRQTQIHTNTESNPTANRVPRGKVTTMTTINQFLLHRSATIPQGLRTGAAVVAAGVSTGVSIYLLSLLVGSWA
jgi:hypothetical protein